MPPPGGPTSVRAFVALPLSREVLDKIRECQDQLRQRLGSAQVRWAPPEQVHLTLRFFGNVPVTDIALIEEKLRQAARGCAAFHLRVRSLGCFPSFQKPGVIWLGLEGDVESLVTLQRRVEAETESFGSQRESRAFHPHLTLGRTRASGGEGRRLGEALRSAPVAEIGEWQVGTLELMQSKLTPQGSVYSRLQEIALSKE